MSVSFKYEPGKGIMYNDIFLPWRMDRRQLRNSLQGRYEIQDLEFGGIISHRDVYRELQGQLVLLFINYDSNDLFTELEIHQGVKFAIQDKLISIGQSFWEAVESFEKLSSDQKYIDETEVLFVDLKLSICSGSSLGGEATDEQLSYIYCSENIEHLLV